MKRLLFIILSILCNFPIFGQARLGSTVSQIVSEFSDKKYELKGHHSDEGTYYITINNDGDTIAYYFDADKICYCCAIIPENTGSLNTFVEYYNNHYVIISATEWKMYSENGIADIMLIYPDDGGYYFIWKRE